METNYLIIPGYGNSDSEHWQTYFEEKLTNCIRIQQKSWDNPQCNDWVETINTSINQYKPETIVLVAHSLGCIAIAHWALKYKTKIKGAMIVAPPDVDIIRQEINFETFRPIPLFKLPFPTILVASTNDHWATVEKIHSLAEHWGSKLFFIGNAGHINSGSGFGKWDEGLEILKNEL